MESNKKINEIIKKDEKIVLDKNYIQNRWVPHISLGVKLKEGELINGIKTIIKNYIIMEAKTTRVS